MLRIRLFIAPLILVSGAALVISERFLGLFGVVSLLFLVVSLVLVIILILIVLVFLRIPVLVTSSLVTLVAVVVIIVVLIVVSLIVFAVVSVVVLLFSVIRLLIVILVVAPSASVVAAVPIIVSSAFESRLILNHLISAVKVSFFYVLILFSVPSSLTLESRISDVALSGWPSAAPTTGHAASEASVVI